MYEDGTFSLHKKNIDGQTAPTDGQGGSFNPPLFKKKTSGTVSPYYCNVNI